MRGLDAYVHAASGSDISTTFVETRITKQIAHIPPPDISLLEELCASLGGYEMHASEKQSIFRVTLAEFFVEVKDSENRFMALLEGWDSFVAKFKRNMDVYMSGFAFSKVKAEVAEAELSIAERHSKVVSEITGKLLGLPLSLVAVIGVIGTESVVESSIYVLGALVVSLIMAGAVKSQQHQLNRIADSRKIVFDSLRNKSDSYPEDLKSALNSATENLETDSVFLKRILWSFRVLAWLPPIASVVFHCYFFSDWIK